MQKELRVFVDHNANGFIVRRGFKGSENYIEFSQLKLPNVKTLIGILNTLSKKIDAVFSLTISDKAKELVIV
jgi:hypothetical protein